MVLAALYSGKRSIVVTNREPVPLKRGEVELEPAFTGVCGTDLHIFHGDMDDRIAVPMVIGHEMSGQVAAVGPGVRGWKAGDPVTVVPLDWCGTCPACRMGHSHVCHNLNFIGIDSPGAMQQRWTVNADALVRLPTDLSLDHAALVEPTAVAVHDVRRAELRAGEKALVVGGGPIGFLIATVARQAGADVVLVELDRYRRSVAERAGLHVLDPQTVDVPAAIGEWTEGAGADVSFEVSGAAEGVPTAVDCLAVRGRLCLVAIHSVPREISLHRFFWRELSLVGARLYDRSDFEQAVELVARGDATAELLISRVEPLRDVGRVFEALDAGDRVMKILVDCRVDARVDSRRDVAAEGG